MKASVIVVSWNGIEYLEDCLNTVLSQSYPDLEVIVIDNASTDGSAHFVAETYPQVRLISNERNLGFAAGTNMGLQEATGELLVLLNQDTVVQPNWLSALVEPLMTDMSIGIVGAKAFYPDGTIQHAGGYVDIRGEGEHIGRRQEDRGQFDQVRDVDFVTGASLAISQRAFRALGGLDEEFTPAYYEDVDWCYRARTAGYRVVYVPGATLIHKEASMAAEQGYAGMCLRHRNRMRFVLKHWPLDKLSGEFLKAERSWLQELGEGSEQLVAALHRAYLYHLLRLDNVMAWRRKLGRDEPSAVDVVASTLIALRAEMPLGPMRLSGRSKAVSPRMDALIGESGAADRPLGPSEVQARDATCAVRAEVGPAQIDVLEDLRERATIRVHEFRSDVPIFGPLIAGFRRQWNRVASEWFVRAMFQQQGEFNASIVEALNALNARLGECGNQLRQQEHDLHRLAEVLAEYLAENGRELGDLAREVQSLSAALARIDD
jgi:GT2 family glycosyltransferase